MDSDTLNDIWARLCRSVPLLGLIAHWSQYEKRITIAINNDAIYSLLDVDQGHKQQHGMDSDARERYIVAGEVISHLLVAGAFAAGWIATRNPMLFPVAWAAAYLADLCGGHAGVFAFRRWQSHRVRH